MVRKGAVQVDIGANPTEGGGEGCDEPEEAVEDGSYEVIDVVDACRLEMTCFNKKSYMAHIKDYMKAIKGYLSEKKPERVPIFEKAAAGYVKKILENFDKFGFYTGENMGPDSMTVLYEENAEGKSYMIYWKDGLKGTKY